MKLRPVSLWIFLGGLLIAGAALVLLPGAAGAQAPEPQVGADSAGTSFPWLALILFVVMSVLLTAFRSHPKYPKKATGNCCAPVVEDGAHPFRIIEDVVATPATPPEARPIVLTEPEMKASKH